VLYLRRQTHPAKLYCLGQEAKQRAGIEHFRFHDLRHTWASWHVQSGTSLAELMELGGWKSYEMVLRYAQDTKHHMIVADEVTNVGHDREQLSPMAQQTSDAIDEKDLTVLADRGYYKGQQIYDCEQAGFKTLVPKPQTSGNKAAGQFDKADFRYIPSKDEYRCPAGQRAIWRYTTVEDGLTIHKYWSSACPRCPVKAQCTTNNYRRITRWEHEDVLDKMQKRLNRTPQAARIRRQTAEHPFGTIKAWMGATHFLTKTIPRVSTEMSLHILAYNLNRAMQVVGIAPLMMAMRA
jgi:hypothetical protein